MVSAKTIWVEVAYARPDEQLIVPVEVPEDATLSDAIQHSRICERFSEIDINSAKVGIFGKLSKLSASLRSGDRIEIYRPLIADPKQVRKQRAASQKAAQEDKDSDDE